MRNIEIEIRQEEIVSVDESQGTIKNSEGTLFNSDYVLLFTGNQFKDEFYHLWESPDYFSCLLYNEDRLL